MSRPNMYMLIGLPGTGKSTWWDQRKDCEDSDVVYVSSDAIIERIAAEQGKTYNEVFKDNIKAAEKEMYSQVMDAVKADKDVVWDQTNLNKKTRAKKLIMIPDHYRKIAVYFEVTEDHEARLASRPNKSIPANIIQSMKHNTEYPELDEGFTVIAVANNKYVDEEAGTLSTV